MPVLRKLVVAATGLALALSAAPVPASPIEISGPGPGHFTSDNVQWVSVNPRHTGSSGGRLHEGFFYVTDPRGVYIYDVANPASPVLKGSLTVF
ncbi:MAG TPA: hypothetical protein VG602_04925, partial [Actinomycetota bacterium]|nr:hypothetical protein [Actinomycetota bacterium]